MLSSRINSLLLFQPPTKELLQQNEIHKAAKRYYDFFSFSDNAIVFLKRYMSENFNFLSHFDQSAALLTQTCHNFYAAWPKLHQDSSPLVSLLLHQLQNTLSLASSVSSSDFRVEEESRKAFSQKISSLKEMQQSIDRKFQDLWKQSQSHTSIYYQKLEEYKAQIDKVRLEYEDYEKKTQDYTAYEVTLVQRLKTKLNEKLGTLTRTKENFDRICMDSQQSHSAVINFFDVNRGLIEEFLRIFIRTLTEISIRLIEIMQKNFTNLKQTTLEILQTTKRMILKASWEAENNFMRQFFQSQEQTAQIKEVTRLNSYRQEFVNAMGFFSQEILNQCQQTIEKLAYFQEIGTFTAFFSQFDPEASSNLLPFASLLNELKNAFFHLFDSEKTSSEQITEKLASQRFKAYSSLVNSLSKAVNRYHQQPGQEIRQEQESIKKSISEFMQMEEILAKEFVKELERLYTAMNQEVWNKMIQTCQGALHNLKDKIREDALVNEVHRVQVSLTQALGCAENIEVFGSNQKNLSKASPNRDRSTSIAEENITAGDERTDTNPDIINKYNRSEYKFIKEKKAESLAAYIKRQTQERLKKINPTPYTVEFDLSTHDEEAVLDSFMCAFSENQGRMYITADKIAFKAYFNQRILFIPYREILGVEKRRSTLGIENVIEIATRKGTLTFASFIFRDKAFDLIQKIIFTTQSGSVLNLNKEKSSMSPRDEGREEIEANELVEDLVASGNPAVSKKSKKHTKMEIEYQNRNKAILQVMPPISKYDQVGYKYQYAVDFNTFFRVFLGKAPISYKGKEYSCCWEILEGLQGTFDLNMGDWNQQPPKDVTKRKDLIGYKNCLERVCVGRKDLGIPLPFVPKGFLFNQQHQLFFVSEKEMVLILELDSPEKIPLSDTFKFKTCYILRDETGPDGKPLVSMNFNYYAIWLKSTMLKGFMTKAAKEDIRKIGVKIDKVLNELISDSIFEKAKKEIEAEMRDEGSTEEEEDDTEEVNAVSITNEVVSEKQEPESFEVMNEENEKVEQVEYRTEAVSEVSEFKVSKKVLLVYFSVSLILFSLIFIAHLLK